MDFHLGILSVYTKKSPTWRQLYFLVSVCMLLTIFILWSRAVQHLKQEMKYWVAPVLHPNFS